MEHGVEVVAVMAAGTGGGSGVRSDALFAFYWSYEVCCYRRGHAVAKSRDIDHRVLKCMSRISKQKESEANPDDPEDAATS